MRKIITEYISKNGIRFHHSISTHEKEKQDVLLPESHHMCEVILLLSGAATYKIEGQSYHLSSYDAIIIHPNKLHAREIDPAHPYERMVLHFSPDLLPSFADLNLLSNYNNCFLPTVLPKTIIQQSNFIHLMQDCEKLCENQTPYTDLRFVSLILQILETLNEITIQLDKANMLSPIKVDKISYTCIQYINENLTDKDKLTPQNLANELHISPSHLQHTFKKEMGLGLHAYIYNQKMQFARKLLLQGETPQTVANLLDYEYYSTFYHNFVKRFGVPPHFFHNFKGNLEK